MIDVSILEKSFYTLPLGIGDEHLPKMIVAHQPNKFFHPFVIKFVEDVIKE